MEDICTIEPLIGVVLRVRDQMHGFMSKSLRPAPPLVAR